VSASALRMQPASAAAAPADVTPTHLAE